MKNSPRDSIRRVYNESGVFYPTLIRPPWILKMMKEGTAAFFVRNSFNCVFSFLVVVLFKMCFFKKNLMQ